MKCSYCGRDIGSGIGLLVEVYHSLSGYSTEIAEKYCLKCYREEVEPHLPAEQTDLTDMLSELQRRQQIVRLKNMNARMKAEEMRIGRIEP